MKTHTKQCLNCGKETKNNKFCSMNCSAKYNNTGRKHSLEEKIKKARKYCENKETYEQTKARIIVRQTTKNCKYCYSQLSTDQRFFCSFDCSCKYKVDEKHKKWDMLDDNQQLDGYPSRIKIYLILRNGHQCSICKNFHWEGKPIPLVLDHIDGHSENNCKANLRLVCGNCDMQLPTYKSKNRGNGRYSRRERYKNGQSF